MNPARHHRPLVSCVCCVVQKPQVWTTVTVSTPACRSPAPTATPASVSTGNVRSSTTWPPAGVWPPELLLLMLIELHFTHITVTWSIFLGFSSVWNCLTVGNLSIQGVKPDFLCVCGHEESNEVFVLEEAFMTKSIKYQPLLNTISELGYRCRLLALVFGCLGHLEMSRKGAEPPAK